MGRNGLTPKLWMAVATVAMVAGLSVMLSGQEKPQHQRVPMSQDWSTQRMVFSNPGSFAQATKTHPFLDWYKVQIDPRYQFSQIRRNVARQGGKWKVMPPPPPPSRRSGHNKNKPDGDWNNYLGGASNAGISATLFPAKYTWDVNAPPDCDNDFIVVPINQSPASETGSDENGQASIIAFNQL